MNGVRVTARNLRTLVGETVPFASADDGLPALRKVLLETHDGDLVGSATDRFRVAVSRVPLHKEEEESQSHAELQVAVHVQALKGLVQLFRPTRWNDPVLELQVAGADLVVTCEQAGEWLSNAVVKVPAVSADGWPDVRSLLKKCLAESTRYEGDSDGPRGYSPEFLADFKCVQRDRHDVLVLHTPTTGHNTPTVVECGHHFIGLLMPRRRFDNGGAATTTQGFGEWSKRLDAMPKMPELGQRPRARTSAGRP